MKSGTLNIGAEPLYREIEYLPAAPLGIVSEMLVELWLQLPAGRAVPLILMLAIFSTNLPEMTTGVAFPGTADSGEIPVTLESCLGSGITGGAGGGGVATVIVNVAVPEGLA
jgi:hypothetical protein